MRAPFVCRRESRWIDGWRYGDWQQWVCKRGDETQCARVAVAPYVASIIAAIFLFPLVLIALTFPSNMLIWSHVFIAIPVLTAIAITPWAFHRAGWDLMIPVGPMNKDGRRVFDGEDA